MADGGWWTGCHAARTMRRRFAPVFVKAPNPRPGAKA